MSPSTASAWPLMLAPKGLHKYNTKMAISCGVR